MPREIIGGAEIIGYTPDGSPILGAGGDMEAMFGAGPRNRYAQPPGAGFVQQHPGQVQVVQTTPQQATNLFAPIPQTTVAALATKDIVFRPQVPAYRLEQLFVDDGIASNFDIMAILVGTQPQTANSGPLPAIAFRSNNTVRLRGNTVSEGLDITVSVRNNDGAAPHDFKGFFVGTMVR